MGFGGGEGEDAAVDGVVLRGGPVVSGLRRWRGAGGARAGRGRRGRKAQGPVCGRTRRPGLVTLGAATPLAT